MSAAYLSEMYNSMSKDIIEGCDFTFMVAEGAIDDILEFGTWMGKEVKTLTDKTLPKPFATIVQRAFNSLPFFLACQVLPVYITLPAMLGLTIINLLDKNPFSNQTNCNINHGVAFSRAYRALENTASFVFTGDIRYLAAAVISGIFGAAFYIKGRQYEGGNPL